MTSVRLSPSTSVDEDVIHLPTPSSNSSVQSLSWERSVIEQIPRPSSLFYLHPAAGSAQLTTIRPSPSKSTTRALDAVPAEQVRLL